MKNILGILLLASAIFAADPLDLNHITITTDQADQAVLDEDLKFYQAESIRLDIFVKRNGKRVDIPTDAYSVWTAWTDGAPTTLYINDTGTVQSVEGQMRNELTPAEANLAVGTYKTQVQLFEGATRMGVIASGELVVSYSPSSGDVVYTGPTGAILSGVTLTNWTSKGTVTGLDAVDVVVDASSFTNNLSATDTKVQIALQTLDAMTAGGGSGDLTEVQVSGGLLTVASGTGPVPVVGVTTTAVRNATAIYLPLAGGAMAGAITTSSTFDGVDVGTFKTAVDLFDTAAERKTLYSALGSAWTDGKDTTFLSIDTAAERKTLYAALGSAFTDALFTKLGTIAENAEVNPAVISQADAEAGTSTTEKTWTAERVKQAIAALASGGGGGGFGVIGAADWLSFNQTGDSWAHLLEELDTGSHALEAVGIHSTDSSVQIGRLKATFHIPRGSVSLATTDCLKIKLWSDAASDGDCAIEAINIYGSNAAGAFAIVFTETEVQPASADTPIELVYDDSDAKFTANKTTMYDRYTVEIELSSKDSNAVWIHQVSLEFSP